MTGGYLALLRTPAFLLVWASVALAEAATDLANYVLIVEVERLTRSSAGVGWVLATYGLGTVLLGPPGGVFVDRVSKRGVLFWSLAGRGLVLAVYLLAPPSLPAIYGVAFAAAAVSQLSLPAQAALQPLVLRPENMLAATALFQLTYVGAQAAGLAVAGPLLYKLLGPSAALAIAAVAYALAAAGIALLPLREQVPGTPAQAAARVLRVDAVWRDMAEAWRFLRATPAAAAGIGYLTLGIGLMAALVTLGPGYAGRALGLGVENTGVLLMPAAAGMVLATVLLGQFATRTSRRALATRGLLVIGLSLAVLAAAPRLAGPSAAGAGLMPGTGGPTSACLTCSAGVVVVLAAAFALGAGLSSVTVPAQTALMEATGTAVRGRVFALLFILTEAASGLPALVAGAAADALGVVPVLLALAVLLSLTGAAGMAGASWRRLSELRGR